MAISDAQRLMAKKVLTNTAGRMLRRGSKGVSVRALQAFLADKGYDVGRLDGVFGKRTQAALKAFQKASGVSADGKAGQTTFNKIRDAMGVIPVPRENPMFATPEPVEPVASADLPLSDADMPQGAVIEETIVKPQAPAAEFAPSPDMDLAPDAFLDAKEREWGVDPIGVSHMAPLRPDAPMPVTTSAEEMAKQALRDQLPVPPMTQPGDSVGQFGANPRFDPTNRVFQSATSNPNTNQQLAPLVEALLGKVGRQNPPQMAMGAGMSPNLSMNDMVRALTMGR